MLRAASIRFAQDMLWPEASRSDPFETLRAHTCPGGRCQGKTRPQACPERSEGVTTDGYMRANCKICKTTDGDQLAQAVP
jgi:hypothetical protein